MFLLTEELVLAPKTFCGFWTSAILDSFYYEWFSIPAAHKNPWGA